MANIKISGLPSAALPLDGPNSFFEVQTIEAGVEVSRKVASDDLTLNAAITVEDEGAPLAGPADTLNFVGAGVTASGAGSTKTITIPMTGQVNVVVGGTNINVDAGDPINPIVNLDAAITGVSVNGVTLSNAGLATDFLNEEGNYVAVAGGIGGTIADNQVAIGNGVDAIDGSADFTWDGNFLTVANASGILLRDSGFLRLADPTDTSFATFIVDANNDLVTSGSGSTANWRIPELELRLEDATFSNWLSMVHTDPFAVFSQVNTQGLKFDDLPLYMLERAAANADELTYGQFWVRNTLDGEPMFTDDQGVDTVLNAAGSIPDPLIIGSINLTSSESVSTTGTPYDNVPLNIGANLVGTQGMTQMSRQNIQVKPSAFGFNSTLFININGAGTAGADTIIGGLNGAQLEVEFGVAVRMQHAQSGTEVFVTDAAGIRLPVGSMYITEKAAAAGDVAGDGQFWVRNDVPNTPMFTTDTGVDIDLSAGGGVSFPLDALDNEEIRFGTGQDFIMDFDGSNMLFTLVDTSPVIFGHPTGGPTIALRDNSAAGAGAFVSIQWMDSASAVQATLGTAVIINQWGASVTGDIGWIANAGAGRFTIDAASISQSESAAPAANIAGEGQWWVRSAAPARPMFTDDTDVDQEMDPSRSDTNVQNGNYTFLITDKGRTIAKQSGGAGETYTIPASGAVAYQIGTWIAIDNDGGGDLTIAITTDVLVGTDGVTGSRTLGDNERALIQLIAAARWRYQASDL